MNLVIQSLAPFPETHLKPLIGLARGTRAVTVDTHAIRIEGADPAQRADLDVYCGAHALDYAFVEPTRRLSDFGLLVMDRDSTLITVECIDGIAA